MSTRALGGYALEPTRQDVETQLVPAEQPAEVSINKQEHA